MALVGSVWFVTVPGCLALLSGERVVARPRRRSARTAGSIIFAGGASLSLWAARELVERGRGTPFPLDPTTVLVTDGLYGRVRNPQAIAMMLMAIGESTALRVPYTSVYLLLTLAYLELAARPFEDRQLSRSFGVQYHAYRRAVPRWRPNWKPYLR